MKVLLCERSVIGHRAIYAQWLSKIEGIEFFCYAPENVGVEEECFIQLSDSGKPKSLGEYLRWVKEIRRITKENNIDVVHFLDGDTIMKFFGIGFSRINAKKLVITYHHFFEGLARRISYKMMNARRRCVSVAHTDSVKKALAGYGIKDVELCEYPAFNYTALSERNVLASKDFYGLPHNVPTIGIVGGMSSYKHIPAFLKAICDIKQEFCILLCGSADSNTEKELRDLTQPYAEKVFFNLKRLSDDEYETAIAASDIIYCIYGTEFDGASGPLTDGVCAGKMILSCSHGSLGQITTQNHLGYTADCNNQKEISEQTQNALESVESFSYDETAEKYRDLLKPDKFLNRYKAIYNTN